MFGGYGLYFEGVMFALIVYDVLYFKVGDANREDYIEAGMGPFTYKGKGKPMQMSYFQVPSEVYEDLALLPAWMDKAHAFAKAEAQKEKSVGPFHYFSCKPARLKYEAVRVDAAVELDLIRAF